MVGPIAHDGQMASRFGSQLSQYTGAIEIMEVRGIPGVDDGRRKRNVKQWGSRTQRQQRETDHRHGANQEPARGPSLRTPQPHGTHRLQHQSKDCGRQGCGVVRRREINGQSQSDKSCTANQQQESRLAAYRAAEPAPRLDGKPCQKRKCQHRTEVKKPEGHWLQQQCAEGMTVRQVVLADVWERPDKTRASPRGGIPPEDPTSARENTPDGRSRY